MKKLFCGLLTLALASGVSVASFAKKESSENLETLSPEESTARLLKSNDANKDGRLAKNEVNLGFRVKRFARVDENKDGFLDEQELKKSFEKTQQYNQQRNAQ